MECQQSSSKGWRGLFVSRRGGGKEEKRRKKKEGGEEEEKKGGGPLPVSVCLETA